MRRLPSHQLPDQCQGVQATPLVQVFSPDSNQREVSLIPAQLHGIITVLQLEYMKKQMMHSFNLQFYILFCF